MSLSSLAKLKNDTNKEKNNVINLVSRYNGFVKELDSAFNDDVGTSSKESIISIKNKISNDLNNGCLISQNSILELEQGYMKNQDADKEINSILDEAERIMRGISNAG